MDDLTLRMNSAFDQLTRYCGHVANVDLVEALEALSNINDDVWNAMHESVIRENVNKLRVVLDRISPPVVSDIQPVSITVTSLNPAPIAACLKELADSLLEGKLVYRQGGMHIHTSDTGEVHIQSDLTLINATLAAAKEGGAA